MLNERMLPLRRNQQNWETKIRFNGNFIKNVFQINFT